jgi:hypothetical protein
MGKAQPASARIAKLSSRFFLWRASDEHLGSRGSAPAGAAMSNNFDWEKLEEIAKNMRPYCGNCGGLTEQADGIK